MLTESRGNFFVVSLFYGLYCTVSLSHCPSFPMFIFPTVFLSQLSYSHCYSLLLSPFPPALSLFRASVFLSQFLLIIPHTQYPFPHHPSSFSIFVMAFATLYRKCPSLPPTYFLTVLLSHRPSCLVPLFPLNLFPNTYFS
jgi:hypothetical protein